MRHGGPLRGSFPWPLKERARPLLFFKRVVPMRLSTEAAYFPGPFELTHRREVERVCRPHARLSLLNDVARNKFSYRIGPISQAE
jgi:hypothetical protein